MPTRIDIRPECPRDIPAIRTVNQGAFAGDSEANLLDRLRDCDAFIPRLSLVALAGGELVGHLLMTRAAVVTAGEEVPALALAPMAVAPRWQRRGVGSALVRRALDDAPALGHSLVIVVGHPAYYPHFGFVPASRYAIRAPFEVPDEAFMARWLDESRARPLGGVVRYAPPFAALDERR